MSSNKDTHPYLQDGPLGVQRGMLTPRAERTPETEEECIARIDAFLTAILEGSVDEREKV